MSKESNLEEKVTSIKVDDFTFEKVEKKDKSGKMVSVEARCEEGGERQKLDLAQMRGLIEDMIAKEFYLMDRGDSQKVDQAENSDNDVQMKDENGSDTSQKTDNKKQPLLID